ncbi:MAG: zinc ABC transporter substrate-binding protein [Lactobacillus sp.]|nr:zinc ABC transporter substrate-binding protein [Lactobacillus sp.]
MKKKMLIILLAMFALVLTGCSKQGASGKINVVTSTNVYQDIAKNIIGKDGTVTAVISNGNVDPHDFEPTTDSAKVVAKADIVVENGLGYDSWMKRLAEANNKKVMNVGKLMGKKTGDNPHIWYNLSMVKVFVNELVKEAGKLAPSKKATFEKRAKAYLAQVDAIKDIAKKVPATKKSVFVTEPVFDYALQASGLKIGDKEFEEAIENETDPSVKTVHAIQTNIKNRNYAAFVYNTQVQNSTISNLLKMAKQYKIPVIQVRETMPNNVAYLTWMRQNYQQIIEKIKK